MAVRVLVVLAAFTVLYGCGQASSPPERQEKQGGVEEAAPEEEVENEQKEEKEKVAPGYTPEEQAKADAAKAAAAKHEITPEDLPKMDAQSEAWFLACQMFKYQQRYGVKALDDLLDKTYQKNSGDDKFFLEKAFMREGISCTWQETMAVGASGSAAVQPEE
jgi:hypothetical protein